MAAVELKGVLKCLLSAGHTHASLECSPTQNALRSHVRPVGKLIAPQMCDSFRCVLCKVAFSVLLVYFGREP